MASSTIGGLFVNLALNSAEFVEGLKRAQASLSWFQSSVKSFAKGVVAGLSIEVISDAAIEAVKAVAELGDVAESIGITAEEMQNYNRMALASGTTSEMMAKGLQSIAEQSVDAESKLSKLFAANGLNAQAMKTNEAIRTFMTLLRDARTPAEQLNIITTVLGDKVGRQLVESFRVGAEGADVSFRNMVASGEYHTNAEVARLQDLETRYNEVMARIATNWQQMIVSIVSGIDYLARTNAQAMTDKTGPEIQAQLDSLKAQLAEKQSQSVSLSGRAKFAVDEEIKRLQGLISVYEQANRMGGQSVADGKGDKITPPAKPTILPVDPPKLKAAKKEIDEATRALERMKTEGKSLFEQTRTPLEHYNLELTHLNDLLKAGAIDQDTFNRAVKAAQEDYFNASKATDDLSSHVDQMQEAMKQAGDAIGNDIGTAFDGLIDGSMNAKEALKSFAASALKDLGHLFMSQAFQGISGMFGGGSPSQSSGGGFFGSLFSGLAGAFGGFFADGGTLGAGKWGIAGEAGPELIRGPASITPMDGSGGGGEVHVILYPTAEFGAMVDGKVANGVRVSVVESQKQGKRSFGSNYRDTQVRQF